MDVSMEDRIHMSVDLLVAMTVEEIAEKEKRDPSDVFPEFLESRTASMLYDEDTKFWWNGPSHIAEVYEKEKKAFEKV